MKTCNKCRIEKSFIEFTKDSRLKSGIAAICRCCKSKQDLAYKARTKEKRQAKNKEYYLNHKEEIYEKNQIYKKSRIEKTREYGRNWEKRNKLSRREAGARYRARKFKAAISYHNYKEQIKQIYLNCPENLHVDHIVPLAGENVCGLHVPWNLQYLTIEENSKKGNRLV